MSRKNGQDTGRGADGRFGPGNPGRPKGSRHRITRVALELLDGEAEALTRCAIEAALDGDARAMRLCLERIVPPRREAPVEFDLPAIQTSRDASLAAGAVLDAVASGNLTPSEGAHVMALVEGFRRTLETTELEARIVALERSEA
ncbi:DUF5681 domain-containing protein [Histidinibacterium aquaticum]|uniref:DUF5681 domain-containing protein n=1 Tax=Histidinibacterium aquaticum TaxID=2613962 RepID=A0A5J5GQ81_9RHOB|nr:hypothetical protein F3S47_00070 [Histidinibacterium aquaticum]